MNSKLLVSVLCVAVSCSPSSLPCDLGCAAGSRCDATTGVCVSDDAPTLSLDTVPQPVTTASFKLSGQAGDDDAVARVEWSSDDGASWHPTERLANAGRFSATIHVGSLDAESLKVRVRAVDSVEQTMEQSVGVVVDNVAPMLELDAINEPVGGASVTIRGVARDHSGISEVTVSHGTTVVSGVVGEAERISAEFPLAGLESGGAQLTVRAVDHAGNATEQTVTLSPDATGPVLTLTAPGSTETLGAAAFMLQGTATDPSGPVTSVSVTVGGATSNVMVHDGGWALSFTPPPGLDGSNLSLELAARDRFDNTSQLSRTLRVDSAPPVVHVTTPSGAKLGGGTTTLEGTVSDSSTVTTVDVSFGNQAQHTAVTAGAWVLGLSLPVGIDEDVVVTVSATDAAGNTGSTSTTVHIDTLGPTVAVTPEAVYGTTATLAGTSSGVTSLTVDVGDGSGPHAATVGADGSWTYALRFPSGLDEPQHALSLVASDAAGNSITLSPTINLDTTGPVVTFDAPDAGATLTTRTVHFSGTATDRSGPDGTSFDAADGKGPQPANIALGNGGAVWSLDVTLPLENRVSHTMRVTVADELNNPTTVTRSFVIDTVPPTVSFVAPRASDIIGGPARPTLDVVVDAADGAFPVASVEVSYFGVIKPATLKNGHWVATFTPRAGIEADEILAARATDASGNQTIVTTLATIDTAAPVIRFTSPAPNSVVRGAPVVVTWAMTDRSPNPATSSFNGLSVAPSTRTSSITTSPTDSGKGYVAQVTAQDAVGNTSTAELRFTVDRVAPTVVSFTPSDRARNVSPPVVTVTFSEPMNTTVAAIEQLSGSWDVTGTTWTSGTIANWAVQAATLATALTDRAGNSVNGPPMTHTFQTAPARPTQGASLDSNVERFEAANDAEGSFSVVLRKNFTSGTRSNELKHLDPVTGQFVGLGSFLPSTGPQPIGVQALAFTQVFSDLSAMTIHGANYLTGDARFSVNRGNLSVWGSGTGALGQPGAPLLIGQPQAGEQAGVVTEVTADMTSRGGPYLAIGGTPMFTLVAPSLRWAAIEVAAANTIAIASYACPGGACALTKFSISDSLLSPTAFDGLTMGSGGSDCMTLTYPASSGTKVAFVTASTLNTFAAPTPGFVVGGMSAAGVLGAGVTGGGVQLYRATTCGNTWVALGPPLPGTPTSWRPVQIGNRAALLYIDPTQGSALRVYYPQ